MTMTTAQQVIVVLDIAASRFWKRTTPKGRKAPPSGTVLGEAMDGPGPQ